MKLHLPLSLLSRVLTVVTAAAVCTLNADAAVMMLESASLVTYADFGQNTGRYVTGDKVNALLADIRAREGVTLTYTNGLPDKVLEHGVPDFSSLIHEGATGAGNLIAANAIVTAKHNRELNPSFTDLSLGADNAVRYQGIEYRNSVKLEISTPGVDVKITRLNKLVTDAVAAPYYSGEVSKDALYGQTVYHSGAGRQYKYLEAADDYWWVSNPYHYLTGGVTVTGADTGNMVGTTPAMLVSVGNPALSDAAPLPYQPQDGDSGSPLFIWDAAANQYAYVGSLSAVNALVAEGKHTTYSKAIIDPTLPAQLDAFTDSFTTTGVHALQITTMTVTGKSVSEAISGTTYTATSYGKRLYEFTSSRYGKDTGFVFNSVNPDKVSKGVYTWKALNAEMDKDNWYHYGTEYMNLADQSAVTSADALTWAELYATRNNRFVAADAETCTIEFSGDTDTGIGYTQFSKADGVATADFVLAPYKYASTSQLMTAGYMVDKDVTVHLNFTNPESYVREWRKVGEGTLSIEGTGDNWVLLNVGGTGKTVLDRTSGFAAYNVLANTGSTVVLSDVNQIARDFTFGNGGATLDFNGNSMVWDNAAAVNEDGFRIHALTEEAVITNGKAGSSATLIVKNAGDTFLGSFKDGEGALAVVFDGGESSHTTLHSIHTDLRQAGCGMTVASGSVTLAGTNTAHAAGSAGVGNSREAYSNADDWHYSDASMNVTVQDGGTFELGSHARLTGDVTVEQGGTYVMHEGVKHAQEYVEGGQVLEDTAKYSDFYGHKGGVVLNGGTLAVQLSEDTDTDFIYNGTISGSGSVTVDAAGSRVLLGGTNTMSGSNTVERGTLVATGVDSLGSGTWTIKSGAVLTAKAFETADRAAVLAAVDGESAGILALTADRSDSLSADTHRNLVVGAAEGSTVNYGSAGDTLAAQDGQWKLGGGGGTLVVKSALNDTATLTLGDTGTTGTVVLENAGNSMNGITVAEQAEMVLKGNVTLRDSAAVTVGNGAALSLTDATVHNLGTTTVSGTVALNNVTADGNMVFTGAVSLDGAFTNNGHVIFNGNVNISNGSATRIGTVYGTGDDATAYTASANGFRGEGVQMGADVGILGSGSYELAGGSTLTYAGLTPTVSTKTGDTTTAVQVETDGIFYVNSGTVTAGGSSATAGTDKATGFSVQKDATLTLAGTTGSKLATATGEGTIQITANTTLANNTATAFNGMVEVTGGTLALGTSADYAKANVASLAGIRLNGGTLSYGGNGTEEIKRLETAVSSVLNISSTGNTGSKANSIRIDEAALENNLEINTTYATQMTVGQLSGSGNLTVHGANNASWGTLVTVNIDSLEGFSGSLNFDRKRNAEAAVTRATIQAGAEDVALRGVSLADGATATITAEKRVSLGSVSVADNTLGGAASELSLNGGSFSADSLNIGAGTISLESGATLALQGKNAGLLFSAESGTATLSGGNLADLEQETKFNLNDLAMSGNAKLDVLRGTATADRAVLHDITVRSDAALLAQESTAATVSGVNTLHLNVTPLPTGRAAALTLADSPAPAAEPITLVSNQLSGVSFTEGSRLTLHLDDVYSQLTAKTQEVTLILNNTAWEDADNMMSAITLAAGPAVAVLNSAMMMDGSSVLNLTFSIPEPATATLSLLALAAMAARRRRKEA